MQGGRTTSREALSPEIGRPTDPRPDLTHRRQSIRTRLHRLVILSVGLALVCSAILSIWQSTTTYLVDKREGLLATANVIAGASSAAVASGDTRLIKDSLRSIARLPGVAYARIEDREGQILAQVGGAVRLSNELALDRGTSNSVYTFLRTRTVQVSVPIIFGGRSFGSVVLVSKTGDLPARFLNVFVIGCLGAVLAIGVGLSVAHRLQRSISRPLTVLSAEMARIAETARLQCSRSRNRRHRNRIVGGQLQRHDGPDPEGEPCFVEPGGGADISPVARHGEAGQRNRRAHCSHGKDVPARCRGLESRQERDRRDSSRRPLHDVGKIAVSDAIMFKPGKLDSAERREMEKHTDHGQEILGGSESDIIRQAAAMAWSHHEWWDGTGYPRGLKGDEIPLAGRVAAVADVCDALASKRPYKAAWGLEDVRAYLTANSGTQFDPACVEALLRRWDEVERTYAEHDPEAETAPLQLAS